MDKLTISVIEYGCVGGPYFDLIEKWHTHALAKNITLNVRQL